MQEGLSPRWRKRTWVVLVWTAAVVAVLILAEVSIAGSGGDDYGLNGVLEIWAFIFGLFIWAVGFGVIWFVAQLIARRHEARVFSNEHEA